jgi:N-acylneuraminate cytidylyltransferase
MAQVGCAVAVADAYAEALAQADVVLEHSGGNGALREICELILHKLAQSS